MKNFFQTKIKKYIPRSFYSKILNPVLSKLKISEKQTVPENLSIKKEVLKFPESALAHKYLDGLEGLEIGGSAHNSFGLNTRNVDYTDSMDTFFKQAEEKLCGEKMPVDIVANGDELPVSDESVDFVISSHTIEHIFDPLKALKEWHRVIKPGGYIFTIVPIKEMVPEETRPTTTLQELLDRHSGKIQEHEITKRLVKNNNGILSQVIIEGILYDRKHGHWTVFDVDLFRKICSHLGYTIIEIQDIDDKVGNGFTIVIKK